MNNMISDNLKQSFFLERTTDIFIHTKQHAELQLVLYSISNGFVTERENQKYFEPYVSQHFQNLVSSYKGRDSSVGIATRYGLDGPGIECQWGRVFPHPSRPALGSTQPPIP
jgi:hypothetical protein